MRGSASDHTDVVQQLVAQNRTTFVSHHAQSIQAGRNKGSGRRILLAPAFAQRASAQGLSQT